MQSGAIQNSPGWGRYKGKSDRDRGAGMARLVTPAILLAFIGIAYWYWSGPYQNSVNTPPVDDTKKNAEIMAQCIAQENFAIEDSARDLGENAEEVCADENGLMKMYGKWYHR
jgi:hypothetical protein